MIKLSLIFLIIFNIIGCGGLNINSVIKTKIQFEMYGIYSMPEGAEGNKDPIAINFKLKQIIMDINEESIQKNFTNNEQIIIINRPQIIYEMDLSNYTNSNINEIQVEFDSDILIKAKYEEQTIDISNPIISYSTPIAIKTSQTINFIIQVLWRNIVTQQNQTEIFSEPGFNVIVKD